MSLPRPIDPSILRRTVEGHDLPPRTLADLVGGPLTLLVFLRHHG